MSSTMAELMQTRVITLSDHLTPSYADNLLNAPNEHVALQPMDMSRNLIRIMFPDYKNDDHIAHIVPSDRLQPNQLKNVMQHRTMVIDNPGFKWPMFGHREDQWESAQLKVPNPILLPLFPRASKQVKLPSGDTETSRILEFTQADLNLYLDTVHQKKRLSHSSSRHHINWLAVFESLEQAVEGLASFEFYPNTTADGTRNECLFVSIHKPNDDDLDTTIAAKFGWLFKQTFPSVGIWTRDFNAYREYRQKAKRFSQYARSPLPILVSESFSSRWLPYQGVSKGIIDKNPLDWWFAARDAGLSSCPMPGWRLDANHLVWHSKPKVLGVGGFGRVISTEYHISQLRSGKRFTHAGHRKILQHADTKFKGWGKIPVAVAVKYVKGGYASQPHHLLRTMYEKCWSIMLELLPPARANTSQGVLEFDARYITKTFGYITHDNYIGLVMEHMHSNLADQIDAYAATLKYVAQRDYVSSSVSFQQGYDGLTGGGNNLSSTNNTNMAPSPQFVSQISLEEEASVGEAMDDLNFPVVLAKLGLDGLPRGDFEMDLRHINQQIQPRSPMWMNQDGYETPQAVDMDELTREYKKFLRKLPDGRRTPTEWIGGMVNVAHALAFMHLHGLVHRDLKPANILFDDKGVGKLADLTFVMEMRTVDTIAGTTGYIPPGLSEIGITRMLEGAAPGTGHVQNSEGYYDYPDGAADIYSYGVCLREIAVVRSPDDPIRAALLILGNQCVSMIPGVEGPQSPIINMVDVYLQVTKIYQDALNLGL